MLSKKLETEGRIEAHSQIITKPSEEQKGNPGKNSGKGDRKCQTPERPC